MERIWVLFSDGDVALVKGLMDEFEEKGAVKVPEHLSDKVRYTCQGIKHTFHDESVK